MTTQTKRHFLVMALVLGSTLVIGTAEVAWLGYSFLSPDSSRNRAAALEATHDWGRLDLLPQSVLDVTVTTQGSAFTREFQISFVAPAEDIEAWLKSSPGTREAIVTNPSPGTRHFKIAPGGGAEFAEVTVDDTLHKVSIRVYWS